MTAESVRLSLNSFRGLHFAIVAAILRIIGLRRIPAAITGTIVAAGLVGCAAPIDESWRSTPHLPYRTVPPPESVPPLVHCNDRTGHIPGETPWLFGGNCLCNPSPATLADYQEQGLFAGWAVATLDAHYRTLGVATLRDHQNCNNLCPQGPHVRKGGRCLVPPTPGTLNWEEMVTGRFALPPWDVERIEALGGPLPRDGSAPPPQESPPPF